MACYNAQNSLSPMMFKKGEDYDKKGGGTRNERWRSKSVEHIFESDAIPPVAQSKKSKILGRLRAATTDQIGKSKSDKKMEKKYTEWRELDKIKALAPVVTCILPYVAMDFVASSLLAVGATPLIPEDPADVAKDLSNSKAVVVSASAPQPILEAFRETFNSDPNAAKIPLILVADYCGTNDRKTQLVLDILDEHVPTVISGRLGDIYSVAQRVIEKNTTPMDTPSDISDFSDEDIPKVVVNESEKKPDLTSELPPDPPVMRKFLRQNKSKSVSPPSSRVANGDSTSPRTKSPKSPSMSPRTSPRNSPIPSPRGVRKMLAKKEKAEAGCLHRVPTVIPIVGMKGQFRETQMSKVSVSDAMENAHKLCTYSNAFVHLYETNTLTSGEKVVEITNTQLGMGNLHSNLITSAAVMAAVVACVDVEVEDGCSVIHCAHGLALFYVAAEEAGASTSVKSEKGLVSPGTLRREFLDALHSLEEGEVRSKALIKTHDGQLKGKC